MRRFLPCLVGIALVLVAMTLASWNPQGESAWCFDPVPDALGYRIYWSDTCRAPWTIQRETSAGVMEVRGSQICFPPPDPEPPEPFVCYQIRAYNADGENP